MTNFLVIVVALAGGYTLRKLGRVQPSASAGINAWLLNIAMPAVILKYVPRIEWSPAVLFPLLAPVLVLAGGAVYTVISARLVRWKADRAASVFLTTGLANTSFVGFPLITAFYGASALTIGVLCDQITFVLLSTVGIAVATWAQAVSGGGHRHRSVLASVGMRLLGFPPLLTFVVALILPHWVDLAPIEPLFDALAATLGPLALFSVGLQMSFSQMKSGGGALAAGLGYKLIVAPLLVLGAAALFGITGNTARVAVFEAAMAPMVTVAVLAAEYELSPRLASAMVGLGIPLSLLTGAGWWFVMSFWK